MFTRDIVCQVHAGQKSKEKIDLVLKTFIPGYKPLNLDYACKPDDQNYVFKSEREMVNYFIENNGLWQTFYWTKNEDNPDHIMVGANITEDDQLIMSLTVDGTEETEAWYFNKLKQVLSSEIGVVSYINPATYDSGHDFILKYA